MGVKSTVRLTREEAEKHYVRLAMELRRVENALRAEAMSLLDEDLENTLERMNDKARGGEGFENYLIGPPDA